VIYDLLPDAIKAAYKKHNVAAISVTGVLTIKVRVTFDWRWDTWRWVNGRWVYVNPSKGA
jgi:hypothetical protein